MKAAPPRDQWVKVQQLLVEQNEWTMDGDLGLHDAVEVRLRAAVQRLIVSVVGNYKGGKTRPRN